MVSVITMSDGEEEQEEYGEETMFQPMTWQFPSLTEACASGVCQSVLTGDGAVCSFSDDDVRSEGFDEDSQLPGDDTPKRYQLLKQAAQSIDAAVENVMDRLLPAKRDRFETPCKENASKENVEKTSCMIDRTIDSSGESFQPTMSSCTGVPDDLSSIETPVLSEDTSLDPFTSPENVDPQLSPINFESRVDSSGVGVKEYLFSKQSRPLAHPLAGETQVVITPLGQPSEKIRSSIKHPSKEKRRWLGWFRRKANRKTHDESIVIDAKVEFTDSSTESSPVQGSPRGCHAAETTLSRFIHDDECTLTQQQTTVHTIRIHRVPTDMLVVAKG